MTINLGWEKAILSECIESFSEGGNMEHQPKCPMEGISDDAFFSEVVDLNL